MILGILSFGDKLWDFVKVVRKHAGSVRDCSICLEDCIPGCKNLKKAVVELERCHHQFHLFCLNELVKATVKSNPQAVCTFISSFKSLTLTFLCARLTQWIYNWLQSSVLRCPYCKTVYGRPQVNQPHGSMNVVTLDGPLPGYENVTETTIRITYKWVSIKSIGQQR